MVVGIARAEKFSPNSVDKDRAILEAVMARLNGIVVGEDAFCDSPVDACCYVSMARLPQTLAMLKEKENGGATVLNPGHGVESCRRDILETVMRAEGIPLPPREGEYGSWLKRADGSAQTSEDVVFCKDKGELADAERRFKERGIADYVVSAHVPGDLVKFYGVEGTGFFRVFYPCDEGVSKFGNEVRNGRPRYYGFGKADLQESAERLSRAVSTPIYGGDAIITPSGEYKIIDFNDFPSFSLCRGDAADAIAGLVELRIQAR